MPENAQPALGPAPLLPDHLKRALGWASAFLLGVVLALLSGPMSEPFWDGRARTLIPVWLMAAAMAFGATYVLVALSGPWSPLRYLAHLGVVALGFGLFYLVIFVMIMTHTPSCPDPAPATWAIGNLAGPSVGPQSCPG